MWETGAEFKKPGPCVLPVSYGNKIWQTTDQENHGALHNLVLPHKYNAMEYEACTQVTMLNPYPHARGNTEILITTLVLLRKQSRTGLCGKKSWRQHQLTSITQMVPLTFSTVMTRPSRVDRCRYLMQRSASLVLLMVTNPKPRDSLVRGSTTKRHSRTCINAHIHWSQTRKRIT